VCLSQIRSVRRPRSEQPEEQRPQQFASIPHRATGSPDLGRCIRDVGQSWAASRQGTRHRFNDRAGAPACSRRKRGNQNQEALGRSRGGFSTKIEIPSSVSCVNNCSCDHILGGMPISVKSLSAILRRRCARTSILAKHMGGSLSIDRGSLWDLLDLIGRNPSQASRLGGPWRRADKSIAHERPAAHLQAAE
jgi:hypothetical protein